MAQYKLYCFGESGNSYKAALMLALCGADWEAIPVDYFNNETRSDAFRDGVNAMGEAPVLLHDGVAISQSGVILDYLAGQTGKFGPQTEEERREILRWTLFDNHKFTSYYATLRFMRGLMKGPETPVTEFLSTRARAAYGIADAWLASREFMVGGRPTIADISMAGYVYYDDETGIAPEEFPNILAWKERIAALPGWKGPYELMPRGRAGAV